MKTVRKPAPQLAGLAPYDPKYLPADVYLSANENSREVPDSVKGPIERRLASVHLNRYPDPLAKELRAMIAEANGLAPEQVLVGNGGDELLFDVALAWGGPGRTFLNLPPTFSVYENNARLTGTKVLDIVRKQDFSIDEEAVIARVAQGDIDFVIVTSPNNPTGRVADPAFLERLLEASDALVVADEAYCEFSGTSSVPLLARHGNLLVLRTFSKAYSLAGLRLGYVLGAPEVVTELVKVRQPYSVDAVSQAVGAAVYENRAAFEPLVQAIVEGRGALLSALGDIPEVEAYPSDANFILFKTACAAEIWEELYSQGILVRDLSDAPLLEGCLRVSVGTEEENGRFLSALRQAIAKRRKL